MTDQISLNSSDTSEERDQLIALMSKYVFEKQGLKLARFETFWANFISDHPKYNHIDANDLRLIFVCNLIPGPFDKNTFNLPEEEYIYLRFGDFDPDEEIDDDSSDAVAKANGNDILVVRGENVVQNQFGWESHLAFAKNVWREIFAEDSGSSDDE